MMSGVDCRVLIDECNEVMDLVNESYLDDDYLDDIYEIAGEVRREAEECEEGWEWM